MRRLVQLPINSSKRYRHLKFLGEEVGIFGIRLQDRRRVEEIFVKTKAKKVWGVTKKLKYRYEDHIFRDSKYKWSNIMTLYWSYIRGSAKIIRYFGTNWMRMANERQVEGSGKCTCLEMGD